MHPIAPMLRPLLFASLAFQAVFGLAQAPQDLFPGITATATNAPFPGVTAVSIGTTPLGSSPTVISLDHLEPNQMSQADYEVVSNLSAELSKQAALANFDISSPAWHYQQIVCPAFPDYVFLAFTHGADENGSRQIAVLHRNPIAMSLHRRRRKTEGCDDGRKAINQNLSSHFHIP